MKNLLLPLILSTAFTVASCGQRKTEEAISTPIEVPVEGSVAAPADGTNTNLDTIAKDNTDVATTSGTSTPPSR